MPHTRSALAKKKNSISKNESKWLTLLQAALPVLCRTLFTTFSTKSPYTAVRIHCRKKNITSGLLASVSMSSVRDLEFEQSQYTASTNKCLWGNIQLTSRNIWLSIEFSDTISFTKLQKDDIDISGVYLPQNYLESVRNSVYDWIQDTIHIELSRRRSERIREELVAAVWHPRRLAYLLEIGGWDAVENME